jgi:hypothetical protein
MLGRSVGCIVVASALVAATVAGATTPSVSECLEASDFIANAARSRDNGVTRDAFMERLEGDLNAIRNFPASLRWFAHDDADGEFLTVWAGRVFDQPAEPETHRSMFLRACFARIGEGDGAPV